VRSDDTTDNRTLLSNDKYLMVAEPVRAGQRAEIRVFEGLSRNREDPVKRICLYENGREVASADRESLCFDANHTESGTSTYTALLVTEKGVQIETGSIQVTYTGVGTDFSPLIKDFLVSTQEAGKATHVIVGGKDIGDNVGIREVRLYEDGELIASTSSDTLLKLVEFDIPCKKSYTAEVEDVGGQIIRTKEPLMVNFSGEAFPPEVRFNHVPNRAGKTTRVFIDVSDKANLDSLGGIVRAVLYEDGNTLKEYSPSSPQERFIVLEELTREGAGEHVYHAEFFNGNGKSVRSEPLKVNFTGQDLPPKIGHFWHGYDTKVGEGYVWVWATDEDNLRDECKVASIVLFEDGKEIKRELADFLSFRASKVPGERYYFVEVTNTSGIVARTDKVVIKYL